METQPKTLAESQSCLQEPSKTADPGAKTVKDAYKTSSAENSGGNGSGVSINGKEGFCDDLGGEIVDKTKVSIEKRFGDGKIDSLEDNDGGLEDSEMNGVSSLLKMQQGESLKGLSSVLDFIDKNEKRGLGSDDGDIRGDVPTRGVKERRDLADSVNLVESLGANEGYPDGKIGGVSESNDGEEEEDMSDEGGEFSVGDFVWGKIRSHPWWPGRIYDPLDGSDYAKKVKQRDRILVAYFGDGTFAWCIPSQLRPFQQNFVEMSKQSSSRNFVNAVEEAINEVGRLVDLKMTCSCVPKDNLIGFGRSLAVNAGIKEGLLVPEGGIEKFSTALFEPAVFLPALKGIARAATIPNMLEFAVLKNWLCAFYRAKGGHQLPTYYEPLPIPGLEDDTRNWIVDSSNYNSGVEVTIQGPVEEDWLSSPVRPKLGQTTQSSLQKCQGISEDRQYQRRKQKSIAELLGGHTGTVAENKEDDLAKGEQTSSKQASSAERKNMKGRSEIMGSKMDGEGKNEVGNLAKDGTDSGKPASAAGRKKRKGSDAADGEGKNKSGDVSKAGTNLGKSASSSGIKKRKVGDEADGDAARAGANSGKPTSSSGGKKRKISDDDNVDGGNDSISKRTRKGKKLSESLVAAENKIYSLEVDGSGVKNERRKSSLSRGRKQKDSSFVENNSSEGKQEEKEDKTMLAEKKMGGVVSVRSDDGGKGSLLRERKKSKYLSPPYMNLNRGLSKKEIEAESWRISREAKLGESMTNTAGHLIGSSSILKCSGERIQKKPDKEPGSGLETSDNTGPQTPKQGQNNVIDPIKVKAPAKEVLSHIRSAALDAMYLSKGNSLDMVEGFFAAFRSSIYCDGSNYKMYNKYQRGRKRKSKESEPGPLVKEHNQTDHDATSHKSRPTKIKKNEEAKSNKPKVKQAASASDMKTNYKESDRKAPAAALVMTFGPGSSLPSKNDLIKIYGKFGALNEEETEMLYNQQRAKIVFLKSSDAEEAFYDSQLASPFGAASVSLQLQYLSAETKTRELREISSSEPSPLAKEGERGPDKRSASRSSDGDVSQLNYIRQKLEMMTSMLETSDGKMSPDMKLKLEGEMKGLLEKVSKMVGSSS